MVIPFDDVRFEKLSFQSFLGKKKISWENLRGIGYKGGDVESDSRFKMLHSSSTMAQLTHTPSE